MSAWLQQDWCSSFVLALGHFVWQGALIALALAMALRATKAVAVRYWVSLAALLVMAVSPVVTLGWLLSPMGHAVTISAPTIERGELAANQSITRAAPFEESSDAGDSSNVPVVPSVAPRYFHTTPTLPASADDQSWWQKFAPQLTTTYLCGVALMFLRLVFGLWGGRRLRRRVHLINEPSLLAAMRRQATALGLKMLPVLAYCEHVAVPTVVGVLRPMILLPFTLTSGLSLPQLESVLAHELAHLRRYDHLANLLQRVIESLLFFHPAMWWVSQRMREEREHCCDDLVVACGAMPLDYARSLLVVAELSHAPQLRRSVAAVSLLATGDQPSNLRQRIARLLGDSATPSLRISPRVLMLSITTLLVALATFIQIGVSNDRSPSAPAGDEKRPSEKYLATLPNGDTLELAHLTTASFNFPKDDRFTVDRIPLVNLTTTPLSVPARHQRVWWKGDGTFDDEVHAQENDPEFINRTQLNARFVAVRIKSAAGKPSLCLKTLPAADTRRAVCRDSMDQQGNPVRTFSAFFGPIGSGKSASLRVGVAPDPWGDWQQISPTGERLNKIDEARPHWSSYQRIKVLSAGPVFHSLIPPAGTYVDPNHWVDTDVVLEWSRNHDELFAFEFRAVSTDGKTHMGIDVSYSQTDDPRTTTFHLNGDVFRDRLARFEYRLRPYRHWVTFENVSLQPGKRTDVKIKVESTPDEKSRAGRGAFDVALDPTARLPTSDQEANPTKDANGDPRPKPAAGPGDPRRTQAMDKGIAFLKAQQQDGGAWKGTPVDGVTALAAAALLQAGVKADDPAMLKALAHVRKVEPTLSYTVALQTIVFCGASPKEDAELIRRNVAWLEKAQVTEGQSRGSWSYASTPGGRGDGSCSRFAVLGLDAAKKAGFEVQGETWQRVSEYWLKNQKENGGWGYTPESGTTPTMTLAGIAGLATANRYLPRDEQSKTREAAIRKPEKLVEKSMPDLARTTFTLYALHSLERAGHLSDIARFGELDWKAVATKRLLETQHPDGYWKGTNATESDIVATSFALLVLSAQPEPNANARDAPGLGLHLNIPAMGPVPLALDFAFPIAKAGTDKKQVSSFFIGFGP